MTVGPSAPGAALNTLASCWVPSTVTAWQPKPTASDPISSPGKFKPGTLDVFSSSAKDFSTESSPLRITTNTIGSLCCAAVQISGVLLLGAAIKLPMALPVPAAVCRFTSAGSPVQCAKTSAIADPRGLLQAEDVIEVIGQVLQECLFG